MLNVFYSLAMLAVAGDVEGRISWNEVCPGLSL